MRNVRSIIKVTRIWRHEDVREFCIKHNYFNHGTCHDYEFLLRWIDEHDDPTPENICFVAQDILMHTYYGFDCESTESMMFLIEKEVVNTFFKLDTEYEESEEERREL